MSFLIAFALIATMLVALAIVAHFRRRSAHARALLTARGHLWNIAPRLPLALVAAECVGRLLPEALISTWLGAGSGLSGILIAAAVGTVLPGGPLLAFPLAIALFRAGAGPEALVALITAWSVIAIHRTLIFELPFMGRSFTLHRLAISAILPIVAGLMAAAIGSNWQY